MTPEIADALTVLRMNARGAIQHDYLGACPEYPDEQGNRDPECRVCQALLATDDLPECAS